MTTNSISIAMITGPTWIGQNHSRPMILSSWCARAV